MDKIYRRPTQLGDTPRKKKNEKNRKRNTYLNFRVTPTERKLIEARVSVTGLTKANFFIQSCLYQKILVKGNVKTFSLIKNQLNEIYDILNKNPSLEKLDIEHAEILKTILEMFNYIFGKEN